MDAWTGRVGLVTGAAGGLGRAIVLQLAQRGVAVAVNHVGDAAGAAAVVEQVRAAGGVAQAVDADVSDEAAVAGMFEQVRSRWGRLDILVNNAGINIPGDISSITPEQWRRVIDVNLTGCFLCCRAAAPLMRAGRWGRVVNISSMVGHQGAMFGHVHYAASKAGLLGFTKTLARTLAPDGITVNAVAPGIIETPLLHATHGAKVATLAAGVPLGLGTPEDVAHAVAFLASDAARYITGTTLDVNGGMYLR